MSLDEYTDGERPGERPRPKVYLTSNATCIHAPQGKVAGYVDRDKDRGHLAFVTRRHSEKHRFHKYDGYAISLRVLAAAQGHDAEYVYVWAHDIETTYVFSLQQYLDGRDVPEEYTPEDDPQKVIPDAAAQEVWDDEVSPLIDIRKTGKSWGFNP